ncbi:hypothetical protein [Caminibacter mediatlanticus]|uniref:Uncharacterized protein n=1 Tax=Caminibacter mediatlanticus TB-2 TaxID=391592 RepID=A0AAI9F1V8_9BACT|nr:hypothetical protein [Caminibacter mediatlanticus]EDM22956.1 hypothetical protein CMTB2_05607 [Caminibacter mediatlanticus TB-2]
METKAKNRSSRKNRYEARIEMKVKLLRQFPNAWVYEFKNPLVRESAIRPIRIIETGFNAVKEFWGYYTDENDVLGAEKIVDEAVAGADRVIRKAMELGDGLAIVDTFRLEKMPLSQKEQFIRNSRNIVELLIPTSDKVRPLYEAIVYIDTFDLPIKQNRSVEEVKSWINAVKEFYDLVNSKKEEMIDLIASKIPVNKLGRYKNIRYEIINRQKGKNNESVDLQQ